MSSSIRFKGRDFKEEQSAGASSSSKRKNAEYSTTHCHQANIRFPSEYSLAPGMYLLEAKEGLEQNLISTGPFPDPSNFIFVILYSFP